MDPSRKTPEMSPVDRDGGDQSESLFQPTEKTDEEKTKRLTSAEETAPTATNSPSPQGAGINRGQEKNPDTDSNTQPPLEDQVTNTETPSVDECVKAPTDSKCDRVKDSLSNNVQVQKETTNNSDEKSSVEIESSSSSFDRKIDDENILIPNKPQLYQNNCLPEYDETRSLSVLIGTEEHATKDGMKCGEGMTPNLSSEGNCERQKPLSPSSEEERSITYAEKTHSSPSEEKPLSTSEEKTHSSPSEEKPLSTSEEKTHSSPSEEKPLSTSEEKTHSSPSEEKPLSTSEEKTHSSPSEEKPLSTSEEKTHSSPSVEKTHSSPSEEKPLSKSEEKTHSSPSEAKLPNTSEEKTHSSSSDEKPPSTSEEKTQSSPSEEKPLSISEEKTHSSPSVEKTHSLPSEEKPPSTSSEEKTPNKSSENICDEKENSSTPSEENIASEEKENFVKSLSLSTERCDEKEVLNPSSEEKSDEEKKIPNLPSEKLCDEDKKSSEEKYVEEKILSEGKCKEKENHSLSKEKYDEQITPRPSSEKKCDEEMPSSPAYEEKCNEKLSSSPPSEDKCIEEKAPSPSPEHTNKEEEIPKQSTSDEKSQTSDFIPNSRVEMCSGVSDSCEEVHSSPVKDNEEQKSTESSHDFRVDSSSELVGVKVDDDNEGEGGNLVIDEESQQGTAGLEKCENAGCQESNDPLEKCEYAKVTENVSQSSEDSNETEVDEEELEKMPETKNEDMSTKRYSVLSPIDAEASADIQCSLNTQLEKHDLLDVDSSNSKNEPCENGEVTVGDNVSQNKFDKTSESDREVVENEVDESTKSDIEVSQNKIAGSIIFDSSTPPCAQDNDEKMKNVSITLTDLVSSADQSNKECDNIDVEKVSQTANEESSESVASVSKIDEGLNSMKNNILTPKDQQLSSNAEETKSNTSKNSNLIPLKSFHTAIELMSTASKETTTNEKSDNSSLLCHEIMDKPEDDFNASSDVANVSKETSSTLETEKVDNSKKPQNVNENYKISSSPSNPAENLSAVQTNNIGPLQSSSGGEFQSTSDKKVELNAPINVADENMETTSSVKDSKKLVECVNKVNECSKDVSTSKSNESDNSGNSGKEQTPSEDIQITSNKKVELNVSSENVVDSNEETKTAIVEIEETVNSGDKESGGTIVSNSHPLIVSSESSDPSSSAGILNTENKKLDVDDSLVVVNNNLTTPSLENIVVRNIKDSSSEIDDVSGGKKDISVATSILGADIQNTVKGKSGVLPKKSRTVKKKSANRGTKTQNVSNSRVNRTPLPILPRPPIASTSTFVGNFNKNSAPVKVSKGTTTDTLTERTPKPLVLSKMDVQRIAEMKPTNPHVINPDQLHKNIYIIKTTKPVTQDSEKEAKPKKVSIDCQVDESELSPVGPPYQAVVKGGPAPAVPNPNNQIVVTVQGTFANATSQPATPGIPVRSDGAVNRPQKQERISEAVKFFFQGSTKLDRFFAPNTRQPNSIEAAKMCQNVVASVKEQGGLQQANFEQDKNRTTASKKKTVPGKRKLTPILPKPPGMMKRGDSSYTLDQSQKHDGQVNVTSTATQPTTTTLLTSCGEVKISVPSFAVGVEGGGGGGGSKLQQVVDKLYLAQESAAMPMPDSCNVLQLQTLFDHKEKGDISSMGHQVKVDKIDLTKESPKRQIQPTKEFLSTLKLPSNLTVIPQKVKKQRLTVGSAGQIALPLNDKVEGSVFARLQKLGTVIEVERDGSEKLVASHSETSSPSATPNAATQPDYAQCLRVLDNLTQAGQILASIKKVNPKTAAKSKMNLKPLPNLKKIEVPSMTNKPNLQRRSSLPSDAINRSSPGLPDLTANRPGTPSSEISSCAPAINMNENEHCLKIASNPELTIIHSKHLGQGPPAAKTPPPQTTLVPVVAAGIDCPPLPKILHFEQQLNCPPTISITTEESGGRKEADKINTFRFQLDVSQVREKSEGERVLNCDICSAEYPKVASLKRHYLRKHINVRYISDQDKQNYLAPSKNKNATESSSQKSNTDVDDSMKGLYKCSSCRKCFDEKNDLKNHMFEQHILGSNEFKIFDCSKCSNTFDNIKEFVAHRKICSQKPAPPPPPISLQFCLYCEQSFANIAARNKHHNKSHHFKKKYQKCLICDSDKYRDKSSLFKHMCTQHKEEYFGCEHCHFRFGTRADLDRHNHVKHGLKKAGKKASKQSSTNEDADEKTTNEDNKIEDNQGNQLPSENKLENESPEVVEKVEIQTKLTKNGNSEINSKYELAKMLVRVGPPNATDSEMLDKTNASNKKKPEAKAAKDNKSKSKETNDVNEKEKSESSTEDKVVENNSKVETEVMVESNAKVEKKKKKTVSNSAHTCSVCSKVFGSMSNVARHKRLIHNLHAKRKSPARNVKINQKVNVFTKSETTDESEHTVLQNVYGDEGNSRDNEHNPNSFTRNVKENLLHHLDGKLDSQEVIENDLKSRAVAVPKRRLSFSASFPSSERSLESESKDEQDSKEGLQPISPKSSIEKYSFPKNYDGCGGLTSYFKDMSHLDLFTQKAMRFTPQNTCFENGGASASEFSDIPTCLELVKTERSEQEDGEPCVPVEFSGEWTRPRRYICAVCNFCTGELWEIEDHKLALHPNVWCPHNEVLVEEAEYWRVVYRKRQLTAKGVLGAKAATSPSPSSPTQLRCTKCNKVSATLPDFHRHVLDCGGDTTWAITMLGVSSPGNRRNRKWRPFGSRRRRQQGRRGLKRNIPNTPAKQPGMKIRTKPGDMETIQRMIANLPAKRVSRRVFGDDNEVKTRSQGTISSGSIYSTPFTYQFNNKTAAAAALAKKQAAKLIKPKVVSNGSLNDSPKKDEKKSKLTSEPSEKPQILKNSPVKETLAESPTRKKLKSPDKNKSGTSEKSDTHTQGKNALKRDHSKVDKVISPVKEDTSGALDAKKKQKLKPNVFNVKEGSLGKNIDKTTASGKNKLQTVDLTIGDNKPIVEANKNEKNDSSTSVSAVTRPKASSKLTKQDTDKQKRSSDDFRKRMCIDGDLIMCSGCGTQFDNSSACQRHMKKCSYCTGKAAGSGLTCGQCNTSFSTESLKQAHVCDDRAMPQLSPEEPYPDQVTAATEDIPVLSPEEIGKNKIDDNSDVTKKGPRLTRSESRASISEAVKNEKCSSEAGKSPALIRNSRSGLRQKVPSELNKSVHDETSNLDSTNKQMIGRVLRHRSITNLSSLDDDGGDDSKTTAVKSNESSDVSANNQQKSSVARGRKRPLDEDDAVTDKNKYDEENSVRRETRRGQITNKNTNQGLTSNLEKDELNSNENRRKSMRLSLPSESTCSTGFEKKTNECERTEKSSRKSLGNEESQNKTENNLKMISFEFLKETSETGERQGKRYLCEVCDKTIMEIYLRKHVEGGAHSRNVVMRRDFDNLFPDPGKYITSCNICNIPFSSPFMCFKHQLHNHEASLAEFIESSTIEPLKKEVKQEERAEFIESSTIEPSKKEVKQEVVNDEEDDDDESLIKTKQKLMSKKALEKEQKMDNSSTNVSRTKVDSNKSKANTMKGVNAPSTETEKTSIKRRSVNRSIDNVNEKTEIASNKVNKITTDSSFNDVTIKSEDVTSDNTEKRALRARRSSLPNESTTKAEDNMILNPELSLLREGRRSSLRLDTSSLDKAKETVKREKSCESVSSNNESTKESAVANTDLQLRGRRSLTIAGASGNMDTKDNFNSTQITKSLSRSTSISDSIGGCENGPVTRKDSSTKITSVDAPSTESTSQEQSVVHEASEFVNQDGKNMMYCFICDRSVGKSAYKKHSNSVIHKQNTKFRKEFQEKYSDSEVMTCKACQMDFTHSYLCFRHSMELHPEAVVIMFDSIRTTRSLSSKEEKQVTLDDSNKKILSNKETPTAINKTSSKMETPSLQTVSNKKTPILPIKAENESTLQRNSIDAKKTVPTISTSSKQTTMFEFIKKASTSSLKEDTNTTDLNHTDKAPQNSKTACSKTFPPISSAEKPNTEPDINKKNVDGNETQILPPQLETMTSPFDFINETSAPILSYREVTQSKSKNIHNNRKNVVNPIVSTKDVRDKATFYSNRKSKNPVSKEVPKADSSKKSSTPLLCAQDKMRNENEEIAIPKVSPSTEIASKTSLNEKTLVNTPLSSPKELTDEIKPDEDNIERVTNSEGTILESLLTPAVDPAEVKPANTLFCATCHKRVKIESLQKHSTSSSHNVNYDQSNFDYEVPTDCDKCRIFENFPFACRAHQKSVLKSKKRRRKISEDECSKKLVKSLLGKMSKKKLNKLKKRQKLKQSEKLAETKINRLKKMKINNWQVSVVKKDENEKCEKKATSTVTSQQVEFQSRTTSEFDCLLCNKHFNSALLLVEHQNTTVHKMNASRHSLQNNPLPILPSTIIPSLVKTVPPPPPPPPQIPPPFHTPPQQVPSPNETDGNFGFLEQIPAFSNTTANVSTDQQDLSQAAGEAILAYGWQDTDWSSVRNMSGWDNQSVAGSSSSGIPDTNMSAFWETDVTSSFMGGRSSLGSILDSVNKILADDPDVTTDPHYNLTDLQSEVGAYHDDMLGERSNFLQEMSIRNETSTSNCSSVQENWSYPPSVEDGSNTTLMDLDNQPTPTPAAPIPYMESAAAAATAPAPCTDSQQEHKRQQHLHKRIKLSADVLDKNPLAVVKTERSKRKSSVDSEGSSSGSSRTRAKRTPVDYESRETQCPTCGRHFLGLIAVQFHMASCSNICTKSGATLSHLKRRAAMNTPFDSSLVCQKCKEILNSPEALRSHFCEHRVKSEPKSSRSDKSDKADPINKEGAEKFKSKMSVALGTLLDKALNNLLGAKTQEPDLNTGAIQLLGKLCAVRRKSQQNMKSSSSAASASTVADAALGSAASQTSSGATNFLDHRTLNYKTTAKLRSLMAGEHSLPKLPWLAAGSGAGSGGSSTSTIKPATLPPSPETLVDHLAMMLADGKPVDNSYACPVCAEKFSMPSARNNHMYMHQEANARPRPVPGSNPDERLQSSQNQNNPSEKDWRGVASSSSDSDFATESGEGQQSTIRPFCSECGLAFSNVHEILLHRKEIHHNSAAEDLPVSENIVDSTSGDENRAKKSARKSGGGGGGGGASKSGGGEKSLPGLEPIGSAESLRKRPMKRGASQEENMAAEKVEEEFEEDEDEEEDGVDRKKANKTASKQRLLVLAPEDVRVKAEAALRELSLQKSCINKSDPNKYAVAASCKYGSYRYSQNCGENADNAAMVKARFASIVDKKWKLPSNDASSEVPARRSSEEEKLVAAAAAQQPPADPKQLEPDVTIETKPQLTDHLPSK